MQDGTAATRAKNKYNAKSYDRIGLILPKGEKEKIQAFAQLQGKSLNAFVNDAIKEKIERDTL